MLKLPSIVDGRRLRDFLAAANYTPKHFQSTAILRELPTLATALPVAPDTTAEESALGVLLRWFFKGAPQSAAAVAGFIPGDVLRILVDCGLLHARENSLIPTVMLTPCDEYYFAADPLSRMRSAEAGSRSCGPTRPPGCCSFSVCKGPRGRLSI